MPLPNRVDPFGNLFADASRGLLFGNRGGRFHHDGQTLAARRWVSRRWICCRLHFKGRHREVWGRGYTELFFLDEPTALSAGHRPCFECRRGGGKGFLRAVCGGGRMRRPSPSPLRADAGTTPFPAPPRSTACFTPSVSTAARNAGIGCRLVI